MAIKWYIHFQTHPYFKCSVLHILPFILAGASTSRSSFCLFGVSWTQVVTVDGGCKWRLLHGGMTSRCLLHRWPRGRMTMFLGTGSKYVVGAGPWWFHIGHHFWLQSRAYPWFAKVIIVNLCCKKQTIWFSIWCKREPSFAEPLESVAFFESFVLQIGDGFLHNSILFNSHISDAGGWFSH